MSDELAVARAAAEFYQTALQHQRATALEALIDQFDAAPRHGGAAGGLMTLVVLLVHGEVPTRDMWAAGTAAVSDGGNVVPFAPRGPGGAA